MKEGGAGGKEMYGGKGFRWDGKKAKKMVGDEKEEWNPREHVLKDGVRPFFVGKYEEFKGVGRKL